MHGCTNRKKEITKGGEKTYVYRRYICGRYNSHGKVGGCRCNTITEVQLLRAVVRRIGEEFQGEGNLAHLRAEVRRLAEAKGRTDPGRLKALRAKLETLLRQIDQGAEKLLACPAELTDVLSAKLQEKTEHRRQLEAEIKALEAGTSSPADVEVQIDKAMACLGQLQDLIHTADRAKVRAVVREMVAGIECHFEQVPFGSRGRETSVLTMGLIRLRPDLLISRDVPSASPLMTVNPARTRPADSFAATRRP
jgi:hypothetical protein